MTQTEEQTAALVEQLAVGKLRIEAWSQLSAMGAPALPAVRQGLRHGHWQVRKWCAILLDHLADVDSLADLVPLLRDPKAQVRLWAVHSLSCDRCKDHASPIDVVPYLTERLEVDESIRVRRMAVAMLSSRPPEVRLARVFERVLETETDRKLRLHAGRGLESCRRAGLAAARVASFDSLS